MHRTVALKQHLENLHKLIDTNFSDCTNQYEQKHTTEWVRHLNKSKQIIGYETPSYDNLYKYTLNAIITKGEDLATKSSGNNVKVDDNNVKTDVLNESFLSTAYQTVDLSDYTLLPPWSSNNISDQNNDNEIENDCTSIEQISKKLQFRKIINGVGTLTNMYQDNCIEMKCNPLKSVINRLERLCTGICMNLSELHLSKSKFQPFG
uniref:SJCHGC06487 protein n=1 Tax=Schistosoma japonicum TaxID=6182 RepID=Q5DC62_SCHJA|nr:SJCHGC06487 protein [Schistosoma japonicum]